MTLSTAELAEERRQGRIAGLATIVAAVLIAGGTVWDGLVNRDRPDGSNDDAERLHFFDEHAGELIAANGLRALGFLLLVLAVVHFHRTTRARNPELPSVPLVVGLLGVVVLALGIAGRAIALGSEAADFVTRDFATAAAADRAAEDAAAQGLPLITGILAFAGTLAIAFWFVLASLNAMRVGLLTRFMGILGIIVGAGFVFGFAPPVMVLWLIAVGVLFARLLASRSASRLGGGRGSAMAGPRATAGCRRRGSRSGRELAERRGGGGRSRCTRPGIGRAARATGRHLAAQAQTQAVEAPAPPLQRGKIAPDHRVSFRAHCCHRNSQRLRHGHRTAPVRRRRRGGGRRNRPAGSAREPFEASVRARGRSLSQDARAVCGLRGSHSPGVRRRRDPRQGAHALDQSRRLEERHRRCHGGGCEAFGDRLQRCLLRRAS